MAVASGILVGAALSPVAVAYHTLNGDIERWKEEAEAKKQKLDPIYEKRLSEILAHDAVADAEVFSQKGQLVFLPSVLGGNYYPGLERESFDSEAHGLPTGAINDRAIRDDVDLSRMMALLANDPLQAKFEQPPFYISDTYNSFKKAGWSYKSRFNQAMFQRLGAREKEPKTPATVFKK
ncbi:MAG: hypothetical protein ABIZ49_06305, partial [Opitutaceae bacterium]